MQNGGRCSETRIIIRCIFLCLLLYAILALTLSCHRSEQNEEHEHLFETWVVTVEPTCVTDGERESVCQCNEKKIEAIPALGHDFIKNSEKLPTCTQAGWKEYRTCSRCDYSDKVEIEPLGHKIVHVEMRAATCVDDGYYDYDYCIRCDFTNIVKIAAFGHDFSEWVNAVPPTCTECGIKIRFCKNDINHVEVSYIPPSHKISEWIVDRSPTCTDKGLKHTECLTCGKTLESVEIETVNHNMGSWTEVVSPNCTTVGREERVCLFNCGYKESRDIEKTAHIESEWKVKTEPTCSVLGSKYTECTNCHTLIREEAIDYTNHTYDEWFVTLIPTCTTDGKEQAICSVCGKTGTRFVEKIGHNFGEWMVATEATCTHTGIEKRICKNNEAHLETRVISKLPHRAGNWTTISYPTCAVKGLKRKTCLDCNQTLEEEELPLIDHDWELIGNKYVCKVCKIEKSNESGECVHIWHDNVCSECGIDGGGTKGMMWKLCKNYYSLIGLGSSNGTELVIPSKYNGLEVRAIEGVLEREDVQTITKVVIPDTVTKITQSALELFINVENLTVPFIGAEYFSTDNTHFGYIFGADSYDKNVNYVPSTLKTVTVIGVEGSVTIASNSFYGCKWIERVNIECFATFGDSAFYGCSNLKYVNIPDGVTEIPDFAFYLCKNLKEIVIPSSVTKIGELAFFLNLSLIKAEFEITDGWTANGVKLNLSDTVNAAKLLTNYDEYANCEWLRT